MTVMCIGAHPDDEMGAGGTLAKHTMAGDRVVILTLTRGGMGHRSMPSDELMRVREKEAKDAAAALGAELRLLDYPDGGVQRTIEVAHVVATHVREVRPDIVITLSNETHHPDHNAVHQIVLDAVFAASLPLLDLGHPAFDVPRVVAYSADLYRRHDIYVDIRDTIDTKILAAGCHASQYGDWLVTGGSAIDGGYDTVDYKEAFRARARVYGGHCGIEYAEAFDDLLPRSPTAVDKLAVR